MKLKIFQNATLTNVFFDMLKGVDFSCKDVEHIIVVPDKFSLFCEKVLLENFTSKSFFNVSVVGISGLAEKTLKKIGTKLDVLNNSETLLLTMKAIENVKNEFLTFKKSGINFCHEISKIIAQLKSSKIKIEDIVINNDSQSGKKFHDIKLIYSEYQKLLENKLDVNDRLEKLSFLLNESDIFKDTYIYFGLFDSFTIEGFGLIELLAQKCKTLSIALAKPISISNEYIYDNDIYFRLQDIAKRYLIEIEAEDNSNNLIMPTFALAGNLFGREVEKFKNDDFYYAISSSSILDQCQACAKLIYYYVSKGYRYRDIKVAIGDKNIFQSPLEDAFEKFNIPVYISSSEVAINLPLCNLIIKFFETIVFNYSEESLLALFSNSLLGNFEDLIDKVQSYNISNKIKYNKKIKNDFKFDYILEKISIAKTGKDFQDIILEILKITESNFNLLINRMESQGYLKEVSINNQTQQIILETLDLISKYAENISISEFLKSFKLLLSFKEVESVPAFVDSVEVIDATDDYCQQCKVLIVLGGEKLPISNTDNGILSDDDINRFNLKKKIEPTIRMLNRRSRFKFFNLLTSPSQKLVTFFSTINAEGKKNEVPTFVQSLQDIFSQSVVSSSIFNDISSDNIELTKLSIGNDKNLIEQYYKNLDNSDKKIFQDFNNLEINKNSIDNAREIFFKKGYISPSQLECYFNCPFKHFAQYGLNLKEKEVYSFSYAEIGTLCHAFCEEFVKQYNKNNKILVDDFINKNFDNICIACSLKDKLDNSEDCVLLKRFLKKQIKNILLGIVEEFKVSSFRPLALEKNVSFEIKKGLQIKGKIDRIDTSGEYLRILDYKTGKTGSILKELYYGIKLQLFLYSKIAETIYNKKSVGTLYFNAKFDYVSSGEDKNKFKGIIENEEEIINLFDKNLESIGESNLFNIKKGKNGFSGNILAKDNFEKYHDYSLKLSQNAINEIENGMIEPKPNDTVCKTCPYKALCQNDGNITRKMQTISNFKNINIGE